MAEKKNLTNEELFERIRTRREKSKDVLDKLDRQRDHISKINENGQKLRAHLRRWSEQNAKDMQQIKNNIFETNKEQADG